MKRCAPILTAAIVLVVLTACSSHSYGDRYRADAGYWTANGSYTVGYRDRNGDHPLNGAGFSIYGRYRETMQATDTRPRP